jgi:RNA polymerase sigma-70 factor (ECF subfamily)
MSAPAAGTGRPPVPFTPAGHRRRRSEQLRSRGARPPAEVSIRDARAEGMNPAESSELTYALDERLELNLRIAERGLRRRDEDGRSEDRRPHAAAPRRVARLGDPIPRGSPPAIDAGIEAHVDAKRSRARRLDRESRAWVEALHSVGQRRDEAIRRLHALVLREARFEVRRRTASLSHPSGSDLDDLAVQAADDAVVAILAKLDHFRGESLFTTWARRFAQLEAPAKIRQRLGRGGELPMDIESEHAPMWPAPGDSPHERCVARESARALARLIAHELTAHQREVLIALVIDGVATPELARRLDTTSGALYKTLHDARRKLKAGLAAA